MVDHVQLYFIYSPHQRTPLHWAALIDHVGTVRCLVDKGTDLSIKEEDGVREQEYSADCKFCIAGWSLFPFTGLKGHYY